MLSTYTIIKDLVVTKGNFHAFSKFCQSYYYKPKLPNSLQLGMFNCEGLDTFALTLLHGGTFEIGPHLTLMALALGFIV